MHSAYKSQMPKEHRSFFRDERVSEAEFNCAVEKEDMEMAQCPYWETDRSSSSSAFNYFPTASNSRVRRITFADDSDRKEEAKLRRNRVTSGTARSPRSTPRSPRSARSADGRPSDKSPASGDLGRIRSDSSVSENNQGSLAVNRAPESVAAKTAACDSPEDPKAVANASTPDADSVEKGVSTELKVKSEPVKTQSKAVVNGPSKVAVPVVDLTFSDDEGDDSNDDDESVDSEPSKARTENSKAAVPTTPAKSTEPRLVPSSSAGTSQANTDARNSSTAIVERQPKPRKSLLETVSLSSSDTDNLMSEDDIEDDDDNDFVPLPAVSSVRKASAAGASSKNVKSSGNSAVAAAKKFILRDSDDDDDIISSKRKREISMASRDEKSAAKTSDDLFQDDRCKNGFKISVLQS
jgi:hypothetical protein